MILSDARRVLGGKVDFYAGVQTDPSKMGNFTMGNLIDSGAVDTFIICLVNFPDWKASNG